MQTVHQLKTRELILRALGDRDHLLEGMCLSTQDESVIVILSRKNLNLLAPASIPTNFSLSNGLNG
jgi:hypothetical protein